MSKKHLLPQENEEFLERLGLTEIDIRVYIATLDGGLVSAGEIQQLTGIKDLTKILDSLRDLTNIGLIKTAKGHMPRYYATLPFFRETLSVEKEFMFTLEEMIQSLKNAKTETTRNRERILSLEFPKIINELLDNYYKAILSPIIAELGKFRDDIEDSITPFVEEIERENKSIADQIEIMLKPLTNFTELTSQRLVIGAANEEAVFKQLVATAKQNRLQSLKKAHELVGEQINAFTSMFDQVSQQMQNISQGLDHQLSFLQSARQNIDEQQNEIKQTASKIVSARDEFQAELLVSREEVKRLLADKGVKGSIIKKVEAIFEKLSKTTKSITINPTSLLDQISSITSAIEASHHGLSSNQTDLSNNINSLATNYPQNFEELKSNLSQTFTKINEQDETDLNALRDKLMEKLAKLSQDISEEAKEIKLQLKDKLGELQTRRETGLKLWKERIATLYGIPAKKIDTFLEKWVDDVQPIIESFKENSGEAMESVLEPIANLERETFGVINERLGFVKAMIEARAKDLQKILEFAKTFDFTKSSDTWVVVGLPSIYASLADLLLRTRSKVTVVTPILDLELIEFARTLKRTARVTFVADINPDKDARLIDRIEEEYGRIQLRNYPKRDLYAGIRDGEEILFGYIREGEETVGIRASSVSIVELLEDRLNETVIRNSKPLT